MLEKEIRRNLQIATQLRPLATIVKDLGSFSSTFLPAHNNSELQFQDIQGLRLTCYVISCMLPYTHAGKILQPLKENIVNQTKIKSEQQQEAIRMESTGAEQLMNMNMVVFRNGR